MADKPLFRRYGRALGSNQRAELAVFDLATGSARTVFTAREVIEAPNWTPDGANLIFNAGGELWTIPAAGGVPTHIPSGPIRNFNNDHLASPDGRTIYASADDGHIHALPVEGGTPRQVSNALPHRHYLHGISPDGATLAYVALEADGRTNLFTLPAAGGTDTRLTDSPHPHDGSEFSPDGAWLFFNSERNSPGQSQCFRMRVDGSGIEQLTHDERVNWFPHPSPDGESVIYLSYPPGTCGHPPDLLVELRLMLPDGSGVQTLCAFTGGQGTINVNSWAPDSRRFAFVAYPTA